MLHGSRETVLCNARVVTRGEVYLGSVLLRDGRVADLAFGPCRVPGRVDMERDYLLPGLVDLHTDHLERQLLPRHGVLWPAALSAALAADATMVACGVTTVLDSICVEAFPQEEVRRELFLTALSAVRQGASQGAFKADHLLHLRCETADPKVLELFEPQVDDPLVRLVSLMDHTPGQRQYRDVSKYREYYKSEGWSDLEFARVVEQCRANQRRYSAPHRERILRLARERGLPLASHDDAEAVHVAQALADGINICEFPTTLEAARVAHSQGMTTVMGAPNIVMGRSHSGNVPALEVARAGCLDVLASDYVPGALALAPFLLHETLGLPLHRAVALVSANPARALGLDDRGRIAPGLRADLVRLSQTEGQHVVRAVWCAGKQVY